MSSFVGLRVSAGYPSGGSGGGSVFLPCSGPRAAASTHVWPFPQVLLQRFASIIISPVTNSDHTTSSTGFSGYTRPTWIIQGNQYFSGSKFTDPYICKYPFTITIIQLQVLGIRTQTSSGAIIQPPTIIFWFMQCSGFFTLSGFHWIPWASQVALVVKNPPTNAGDARDVGWDPWVGKTPWRRKWLPTLVFLPGESDGQRSLAGYSLWGHKELAITV